MTEPPHLDAGDAVGDALDAENSEAVAAAVEDALASAETERTTYWIRTLSQRIVIAADDDTS
ncbi:hypothetical protein U3A55_00875 [Salarchaeum sp. III]|uniref:hypothetical protein n=1 Tax=Salarchaeum sp. III TaxID=3107927 RepID=UPI002ED7C97A